MVCKPGFFYEEKYSNRAPRIWLTVDANYNSRSYGTDSLLIRYYQLQIVVNHPRSGRTITLIGPCSDLEKIVYNIKG